MPCKLTGEVASPLPSVRKPDKTYDWVHSYAMCAPMSQACKGLPGSGGQKEDRSWKAGWSHLPGEVDGQPDVSQETWSGLALCVPFLVYLPGAQTWVWGESPTFLASQGRCRVKDKAVPSGEDPGGPSPVGTPCGPRLSPLTRPFQPYTWL